jgi:hypothetical protein
MKDLKLEIQSQTALKKFSKNIIMAILPQLSPFIGKKIFLGDGTSAKIFNLDMKGAAKEFQPEPIEGVAHIMVQLCYVFAKYDKLQLKISLCLSGGSYDTKPSTAFTKYAERTYELGVCQGDQVLVSVDTVENITRDYKLDDLLDLNKELTKIVEFQALQAKADEAKRQIKVPESYYKHLNVSK